MKSHSVFPFSECHWADAASPTSWNLIRLASPSGVNLRGSVSLRSPRRRKGSPPSSPSSRSRLGAFFYPSWGNLRVPYVSPFWGNLRVPYVSPSSGNLRVPFFSPSSGNLRVPFSSPSSENLTETFFSPSWLCQPEKVDYKHFWINLSFDASCRQL